MGRELPRRSFLFDALVALLFVVVGLLLLQIVSPGARPRDFFFAVAVSFPLALRRRLPRTGFGLVFAAAFLQMAFGAPIGLYDSALLFALYTVGGVTNRRFSLVALVVALLAAVVGAVTGWWSFVDGQLAANPNPGTRLLTALGFATLTLATWALGERLRSGRFGVINLSERAAQLERERDQQARLAAAAERARIAREMHDVVAHGLSVMIVQADAAAYVVDQSPGAARTALEQISATGRSAMAEMRNLLGLLRAEDDDLTTAEPTPGLRTIEDVVDQARAAGATVTLERTGDAAVPAMLSLTAFRVVQEALSNARKHGGPVVSVGVVTGSDGIVVTVRDGGAEGRTADTDAPGFGLVGMRERVNAVGGTVSAEPLASGGFEVRAHLPLTSEREGRP